MKKDDCFLMKGSSWNGPMTLYLLTDIDGKDVSVNFINISDTKIQCFDDDGYENKIPKNAVIMTAETFWQVKTKTETLLKEMGNYLKDNLIDSKDKIKIGAHYYNGGDIFTISEIRDSGIRYQLFKLDFYLISPYWSGEARPGLNDFFEEKCYVLSEQTYAESINKYECFVKDIRGFLKSKSAE